MKSSHGLFGVLLATVASCISYSTPPQPATPPPPPPAGATGSPAEPAPEPDIAAAPEPDIAAAPEPDIAAAPQAWRGTVDAHNRLRAKHGVGPLAWDEQLAARARSWADGCVNRDGAPTRLDHSSDRYLSDGTLVGENIYGNMHPTEGAVATARWASEEAFYDYDANRCVQGKECRHYTQMVWAGTTSIGCAMSQCPNIQYPHVVVCHYAPGGNIIGQRPY